MANIDVVPKKSSASWMMWVVLALVALAIVWLMMRGNDGAQGSGLNIPALHVQTVALTSADL